MLSTTPSPARSPLRTRHGIRTAWLLIVMPRSRSMSIRSRYWSRISRASTTSVSCSIRSASVDLPWSMCAMMQKFLMLPGDVEPGNVVPVGGTGSMVPCPGREAVTVPVMKIAVYGAGGVGGYFGGRLAQAGNEIWFLARGAHLDAIRANGLAVRSPRGDFTVTAKTTDDPAEVGPCDVV